MQAPSRPKWLNYNEVSEPKLEPVGHGGRAQVMRAAARERRVSPAARHSLRLASSTAQVLNRFSTGSPPPKQAKQQKSQEIR